MDNKKEFQGSLEISDIVRSLNEASADCCSIEYPSGNRIYTVKVAIDKIIEDGDVVFERPASDPEFIEEPVILYS